MRSHFFSFFFLSCLVGTLGCQENTKKDRRQSRPITNEPAPIADETPAEEAPLAPAAETPMPVTETVVEERLMLACTSSFAIARSQNAHVVSAEAEVSNLDQNKTVTIATHKDEIVELTSHLGTLTLSKRSSDAAAAYIAKATMNAPIFALIDEASKAPATIYCETMKAMPVETNVRFQCDAELTDTTAPALERITAKRETTLSINDDERAFPLAELGDLRLMAYASQGEVTLVVETLTGDWIGGAVGSIADVQIDGEFVLEKALAKASCRRLP